MSALPSPSLAPLTCSRPFLPSIAAAAVCDAPQRGEPRMARPNREAEQTGARPRSNATPRAFPAHQSPTLPTHTLDALPPKAESRRLHSFESLAQLMEGSQLELPLWLIKVRQNAP